MYQAVVERKFDLRLLRGLRTMHAAEHVLHYGGRYGSGVLLASGGMIAGCSAATTLAKLFLLFLSPLTLAQFGRPQLEVRNVIDDIALQIVAPIGAAVCQLAGGTKSLSTVSRGSGCSSRAS